MTTYNGWANYHTWNVALYISNDYNLYMRAVAYAQKFDDPCYKEFIRKLHSDYGDITPDGVSWTDPHLDHEELDTFIRELAQ